MLQRPVRHRPVPRPLLAVALAALLPGAARATDPAAPSAPAVTEVSPRYANSDFGRSLPSR